MLPPPPTVERDELGLFEFRVPPFPGPYAFGHQVPQAKKENSPANKT